MSNSEGDSQDNQQETLEYYCIPRKFVFDVPETSDTQEDHNKRVLKKSLEAEKYMPFIFNFPEPANYKESYSQLVKQIISAYNHIRLLIVEEYYEELKHVVKELKIEQPGDCLAMLKELFSGCCEKMQARPRDNNETSTSDYEELLQKAEAKIRILIRNEQIFRLNFDILSQKCEDAEKVINAGHQEIEAHKKVQEKLTKENQELIAKLAQKDEEVKRAFKQRELVEKRLKEATDNLNALDTLDQATSSDQKNVAPAWNQHLLSMLVKENKTTPSETSSRPPSNFDSKNWNGARQSSNRMTPTDSKMKVEKKTVPNVAANGSYLSNSSGNLNKAQVERLKNSLVAEFKKHMNASINSNSNRAVLNASLDVMLNKSTENSHSQERTSVSGTMLGSKKRNSQQIKVGQSQDQIRVKPPTKERKLGEYSEKDSLPYTTNKSALQKIMNSGNKYGNNSTRPTSTGKSRDSPLVSRSRIVQTEQSPDSKSQESRILHTYASNQSTDMIMGSYAANTKKKSVDGRNKATTKSSMMIKNMIAEHLTKKLGHKAV